MRDAKRIKEVLAVVERIWSEHPDMRLMQLLLSVADPNEHPRNMEEKDLIDKLELRYGSWKWRKPDALQVRFLGKR